MSKKTIRCALLVLPLLFGGEILAEKEAPKGAADKKDPGQAMMEAWQKAGTPGEPHKRLADMAGSFDTVTRTWMTPGAQPMESKGKSENKLIWDGRFLQQEYKGEMMGKGFTGIGMTGYDNVKKKYVGTWMDSMSTSLAYLEGTADAAGKTMTMTMEMTDPMTGKKVKQRAVTRIESPDKHVFELHERGPNGKEFKSMEIVYTRAAKAK